MKEATDVADRAVALIASLDRVMTMQLNAILHHDDLQRLEATWRGLHYLVHRSDGAPDVKLRLLDVSKRTLRRALSKWPVDDSVNGGQALGTVYDDAYRIQDAEPFGCLIGDYWFDHTPDDHTLLSNLAALAELWQAPFFAGAAASLLGLKTWGHVNAVDDIAKIFNGAEHRRWQSLRESDSSRYIGLVLPNMLARNPMSATPTAAGDYEFNEEISTDSDYCWTNSVYALAVQWIRAFRQHGWCGALQAVETDAVPELPLATFPSNESGLRSGNPLDVNLTDRAVAELGDQGLIAVRCSQVTGRPWWSTMPSLCKPSIYAVAEATLDSHLAMQMPFILSVTRFAMYLPLIARDATGRLREEAQILDRLTRWVQEYVSLTDHSGIRFEPSALRPLVEARRMSLQWAKTQRYFTVRFMVRPEYLLPKKLYPALLHVRLTEVAT